jgi:hypothetical protein
MKQEITPRIPQKLVENEDYYMENNLFVLTEHFLLKRGFCCQNSCRHCPYKTNKTIKKETLPTD